uniref:Putative secreted protein n=1 Tax=Anopheles darlingi TaxID=43151 RepID=A0A2M4D1T9_ANODA
MSQTLMVTLPLVTLRMLNPTVGIISSQNCPEAITLTKVVLPEYWSPTSVSSISSFQKRLLNQSRMRLMRANMMNDYCRRGGGREHTTPQNTKKNPTHTTNHATKKRRNQTPPPGSHTKPKDNPRREFHTTNRHGETRDTHALRGSYDGVARHQNIR